MLKIVNFSHPITINQRIDLSKWFQVDQLQVIEIPVQFRMRDGFEPQVAQMLDAAKLSQEDVDAGVAILLPALSIGAAALVAEWHGRYGHFPTVIRLKSVGEMLPEWRVAEVLPLQKVRSRARARR